MQHLCITVHSAFALHLYTQYLYDMYSVFRMFARTVKRFGTAKCHAKRSNTTSTSWDPTGGWGQWFAFFGHRGMYQ